MIFTTLKVRKQVNEIYRGGFWTGVIWFPLSLLFAFFTGEWILVLINLITLAVWVLGGVLLGMEDITEDLEQLSDKK